MRSVLPLVVACAVLVGCGETRSRSIGSAVTFGEGRATLTVEWVDMVSRSGTWMGMCRPSYSATSSTRLLFPVPYGQDTLIRTRDPDGAPVAIRAWIDRPAATAAVRVQIGPAAERPQVLRGP
ncbi:MAG: hypothetical protein RLZZ127_843 [Planctomycetota bacterium]|jgi:hypothetical protein